MPVIIPDDVKKPLEYLASNKARKDVGIKDANKYLFPNGGKGFSS